MAVAASARQRKDEEAKKPQGKSYPSVVGLTLKEAAEVLAKSQIKWRAFGSGVVIEQKPEGESPLDDASLCNLLLGATE